MLMLMVLGHISVTFTIQQRAQLATQHIWCAVNYCATSLSTNIDPQNPMHFGHDTVVEFDIEFEINVKLLHQISYQFQQRIRFKSRC